MNFGTLYICPTPIGNLEDITLRVIRVLKEVDLIACEDTRVTQKLLNHYDIATKLTSYHKFSEKEKSSHLIDLLKSGQNIALVSDAGTPLVSDPGSELIKVAHDNRVKIVPLPGPSALATAVSATYNKGAEFVFIGFLPRQKGEIQDIIEKYKNINLIFYESPSRLLKSLEEIKTITGIRTITVARELTKVYEEIKTDTIDNLIAHFKTSPLKGEITVIVEGIEEEKNSEISVEVEQQITKLKKAGYSTKETSKIISLITGISKSTVYDFIVKG